MSLLVSLLVMVCVQRLQSLVAVCWHPRSLLEQVRNSVQDTKRGGGSVYLWHTKYLCFSYFCWRNSFPHLWCVLWFQCIQWTSRITAFFYRIHQYYFYTFTHIFLYFLSLDEFIYKNQQNLPQSNQESGLLSFLVQPFR